MQLTEDVYEGASQFLFLTGGNHHIADHLSGARRPAAEAAGVFIEDQRRRHDFCARHGIAYGMWIFPDKLFSLRTLVPELGELHSLFQTFLRDDPRWDPALPVFYPGEALDGRTELFSRGDTHYAPHGEIEIVRSILETIRPDSARAFYDAAMPRLTERLKVRGDLARKLEPPRQERLLSLDGPLVPVVERRNGLFRGNNGVMVLVESPEARTEETLLIFGDSFFRSLLRHLAFHFRKIIFCRSKYFHYELVDAVRPDVILGGAAERYLASIGADAARPHFFAYPLVYGREMTPEPGFAEMFASFFDQTALVSPAAGRPA